MGGKKEEFDFDAVYALYPRKEGKANGIASCRKQIKSLEDYNLLLEAVKKYKELCESRGTERTYIKLFSSFMGTINRPVWRDYLDSDIGTVTVNTKPMQNPVFGTPQNESNEDCVYCMGSGLVFAFNETGRESVYACECDSGKKFSGYKKVRLTK